MMNSEKGTNKFKDKPELQICSLMHTAFVNKLSPQKYYHPLLLLVVGFIKEK